MVDTAQIQEAPSKLFEAIGTYNLPGGLVFSPNYLTAGAIVFLIFLLILTFGMLRHRYTGWAVKGIMPGVAFGFLAALLLEAVLLVGGRTVLTEVLGWKDAPKPISNALDASREHLVDVLGVTEPVPNSKASSQLTVEDIENEFDNFSKEEKESLRALICPRPPAQAGE